MPHHSYGIEAVALVVLACATASSHPPAAVEPTPRDTTVVEHRGELELKLRVSPYPREVGPIANLTVSVRNTGDSAMTVEVDPCYIGTQGLPPSDNPEHIFAVCAVGPYEETLAPGEEWSRTNNVSLDIPPGRYSLRAAVTLRPEVWLRLDFTLRKPR